MNSLCDCAAFPMLSRTANLATYNGPIIFHTKISTQTVQLFVTSRDVRDVAQEGKSSVPHSVLYVVRLRFGRMALRVRVPSVNFLLSCHDAEVLVHVVVTGSSSRASQWSIISWHINTERRKF